MAVPGRSFFDSLGRILRFDFSFEFFLDLATGAILFPEVNLGLRFSSHFVLEMIGIFDENLSSLCFNVILGFLEMLILPSPTISFFTMLSTFIGR